MDLGHKVFEVQEEHYRNVTQNYSDMIKPQLLEACDYLRKYNSKDNKMKLWHIFFLTEQHVNSFWLLCAEQGTLQLTLSGFRELNLPSEKKVLKNMESWKNPLYSVSHRNPGQQESAQTLSTTHAHCSGSHDAPRDTTSGHRKLLCFVASASYWPRVLWANLTLQPSGGFVSEKFHSMWSQKFPHLSTFLELTWSSHLLRVSQLKDLLYTT